MFTHAHLNTRGGTSDLLTLLSSHYYVQSKCLSEEHDFQAKLQPVQSNPLVVVVVVVQAVQYIVSGRYD